MTSADRMATESRTVTAPPDSGGTFLDLNLDLQALYDRVMVFEENKCLTRQVDSSLKNRAIKRSERSLLLQLSSASPHLPSMQHSQRLDERLHMLKDEVRTMTQEKERGEQVWRDRLQRCQRLLRAKEEEMSCQFQYFENFKTQLQHKLSLAQDREQNLQTRVYALEKQLLDMTVSAATGLVTVSAARITAGTMTHQEEQERLPSMREEGEGEEERKEERRKQWQPNVGDDGGGGAEVHRERVRGTRETSNEEVKLQNFILSLQEDLRVLLEREEDGMTERRGLMEQLHQAQEKNHVLSYKVEEMKGEVSRLKLSENCLMEEVEELREENHRLQQIISDATKKTPGHRMGRSAEVHLNSAERTGQQNSPSPPPVHQQASAESTQNNQTYHLDPKTHHSAQSLSLTTDTIDEFTLGNWCSAGILNLDESPSEESDALRDAYRSLQLREDCERGCPEVALQQTKGQLHVTSEESTQLQVQLGAGADQKERESEQESPKEKDDLVQALNRENRALADRIQELLTHIKFREEEVKSEDTELRQRISKLEADGVQLEQENQEQGCLITELTRKTEDDLNSIMELQQKLEEAEQHVKECRAEKGLSESQWKRPEESVDSLVDSVLTETTSTVPASQCDNHWNQSENSQQSGLHDRHAGQVGQLSKSVQNLKAEEEDLLSSLTSLREQQRDVALSVQTQTEEKQQLTRTVWGLKEEKDNICRSLVGLKQDREQLTRSVCGLKEESKQVIRSTSRLTEEKDQLTESLSALRREKEKLFESLASVKEEKDQISQSFHSLQTESDQLNQTVLSLKRERDELTDSIKSLKEQSPSTLQDDRDNLMKSVSTLREEKERTEHSISRLKQEEEQAQLLLQGLKEERRCLRAAPSSQTEEQSPEQQPLSPTTVQEQRDLMRQIKSMGAELSKSQEEVDQSRSHTKKLHAELSRSEARREEAEREAAQAAEEVKRLTDAASQVEETREENISLITQVKDLQSRLRGLVREKTDALSSQAQIQEQYDILTAQLKAKTVALEELNSEYIALRQGQSSRDDLILLVNTLRTRYSELRVKYDALLKERSQSNTDTAPLKAKLSCLVVKCQERNTLLLQMMKTMSKQGCADSTLSVQVEQLLSDAALQDYTATFTPGRKTPLHSPGFTPGFISKLQTYSSSFQPEETCSATPQNRLTPEPRLTSSVTTESTVSHQEGSSEATLTETGALQKSDRSLSGQEHARVPATSSQAPAVPTLTESVTPNAAQIHPAAFGSDGANTAPEFTGLQCPDVNLKTTPHLKSLDGSSRCSPPPSVKKRISPSRRLSSPEKILNFHEQLQKTLKSSFQAPESRGRREQPRKCLSFPSAADLGPVSHTTKQSLAVNVPCSSSLSAASSPAKHTPAAAALSSNKSTTLFNVVASRSANVTLSPSLFMNRGTKAAAGLSSSSSASPNTSNVETASAPSPLRTSSLVSDVPILSDLSPKGPGLPAAPKTRSFKQHGAAPEYVAASCSQAARRSPDTSLKSTVGKTKTPRPKPEAPAAARSVEVIKTVGQSSLLIGWERPPLDELGCSNGTFVYGYRVGGGKSSSRNTDAWTVVECSCSFWLSLRCRWTDTFTNRS
ncbi:uncharacterized protein V6R79_001235 [Siganus canaliculatus]